jgi:ribosome recycling factor
MFSVNENTADFDKAIEYLKQDITSLRTGRATPALVEDIKIEAYGTKQPLKAVASISVADAKTITVEPWDKSVIGDIERAIQNSQLGINPVNDGKLIRLPLPELTQDRRAELLKILQQKLEHARIAIRKIREDVKKSADTALKNKEISEDEKFGAHDDLDKLVKKYNEKIKLVGEGKEKEIMKI